MRFASCYSFLYTAVCDRGIKHADIHNINYRKENNYNSPMTQQRVYIPKNTKSSVNPFVKLLADIRRNDATDVLDQLEFFYLIQEMITPIKMRNGKITSQKNVFFIKRRDEVWLILRSGGIDRNKQIINALQENEHYKKVFAQAIKNYRTARELRVMYLPPIFKRYIYSYDELAELL